jgi:hypothetical protein
VGGAGGRGGRLPADTHGREWKSAVGGGEGERRRGGGKGGRGMGDERGRLKGGCTWRRACSDVCTGAAESCVARALVV